MAYTINFSDAINKGTITINDNTINNETSLRLPGKNTTSYGTIIAENFLHLLENFANSTAPSRPIEGQLWFDTTAGTDQLKVCLLYTSPSPRDLSTSRMPSSA